MYYSTKAPDYLHCLIGFKKEKKFLALKKITIILLKNNIRFTILVNQFLQSTKMIKYYLSY